MDYVEDLLTKSDKSLTYTEDKLITGIIKVGDNVVE